MEGAVVPGQLADAAVRRDVAAQDGEAAAFLKRLVYLRDDLLTLGFDGGEGDLAQRPSVYVSLAEVQEIPLGQLGATSAQPPAAKRSVAT